MAHIAEPAGAVVIGCKVLPIFNEHGIVDGAMKKMVHRIDGKKAVARVKELLKRAAQARPHGATVSGKKWKKVLSFHARDGSAAATGAKGGRQQQQKHEVSEEMSCSSSKLSFKWDVGSCSSVSSVAYSPLSLMSAPVKVSEQTLMTPSRKDYCMSRLSSMSQQSMLYGGGGGDSSSPKSMLEGEEEEACSCRTGQWITTDSDFVVLEL